MPAISMSSLENQLMEKIFRRAALHPGQQLQESGLEIGGIQSATETMARYAFKDFVNYFIQLEERTRAAARQTRPVDPATSPLRAAGLHLQIRIEAFEPSEPAAQPVTVHKHETEQGLASRIEIRTEQRQADGSVSYGITVLKLAVEVGKLAAASPAAETAAAGVLPLVAAAATVGDELADFLARTPLARTAGHTIWQFSTADAMDLVEKQQQLEAWQREEAMRVLVSAAYQLLNYLQHERLDAIFDLSSEEEKLVKTFLENSSDEVVRQAMLNFFKKKRPQLDAIRREIERRRQEAAEEHQTSSAQENSGDAALDQAQDMEQTRQEKALENPARQRQLQKLVRTVDMLQLLIQQQDKEDGPDPDFFKTLSKQFNLANFKASEIVGDEL